MRLLSHPACSPALRIWTLPLASLCARALNARLADCSSVPADRAHAIWVRSLPNLSESTQKGAVLLFAGDPSGRTSTESAQQATSEAQRRCRLSIAAQLVRESAAAQ